MPALGEPRDLSTPLRRGPHAPDDLIVLPDDPEGNVILAPADLDLVVVVDAEARATASSPPGLGVKRAIDLIAALIGIVIASPVLVALVLMVALTSRGPVFYVQERLGRDGRPFPLVKLRTMRRHADRMLADYLERHPELAEEWRATWKLRNDPRVTRVGRLMRRYSLDELTQLFNVLVGHMSIVGPRPVVADEIARFGDRARDILAFRPGLTGLWAISGRNDLSYDERVELEHRYVRTWSIKRDISIIVRTIPAVFRRHGAY